jgi:hypothetical protein
VSYLTQNEIAENRYMNVRVAQCATGEGVEGNADVWTGEHRREWAASPGWDAAWEAAKVGNTQVNYDPGADEEVITDGMILSTVQPMVAPPPE